MALMATWMSPSVPFLNPTGVDKPLAISRWVWDSDVRAPMAVQATRSPRYCGVMGSSASVAMGKPSSATLSRKARAFSIPSSMRKESSMYGIVDEPFPSRRGARLLEVDPHHQNKVSRTLSARALRRCGVVVPGDRVVDGAGADDDEDARIRTIQDAFERLPPFEDRVRGSLRDRQPRMNLLGRRHQVEGGDIQVFQSWRCHDRTTLSFVNNPG